MSFRKNGSRLSLREAGMTEKSQPILQSKRRTRVMARLLGPIHEPIARPPLRVDAAIAQTFIPIGTLLFRQLQLSPSQSYSIFEIVNNATRVRQLSWVFGK